MIHSSNCAGAALLLEPFLSTQMRISAGCLNLINLPAGDLSQTCQLLQAILPLSLLAVAQQQVFLIAKIQMLG